MGVGGWGASPRNFGGCPRRWLAPNGSGASPIGFFLSYFFLIIFWSFLKPLSYFFIIFLSLRFFYHIFISYFEIPKIFIISLSYYFEMLKKSYHIFLSYFFIFKFSYHIFWLIYIIFLDFWKYDINMLKKNLCVPL